MYRIIQYHFDKTAHLLLVTNSTFFSIQGQKYTLRFITIICIHQSSKSHDEIRRLMFHLLVCTFQSYQDILVACVCVRGGAEG